MKLAAVLLLCFVPVPTPDCRIINGHRVCRFDPTQQCLSIRLSDGSYNKCVKEVTA